MTVGGYKCLKSNLNSKRFKEKDYINDFNTKLNILSLNERILRIASFKSIIFNQ